VHCPCWEHRQMQHAAGSMLGQGTNKELRILWLKPSNLR
jgi:hypothetical protein